MDITEKTSKRTVDVFPRWAKAGTILFTILAIATSYYINIWFGLLSFSGVLITIGFATTDAWNRELRNDGYAAITHLYTGYISALFVFLSFSPALYMLLDSGVSIILSFVLALLYASIISSIAFRDVDDYKQAIKPYEGPAVVYLPSGSYIEHTEISANNKKNEQE